MQYNLKMEIKMYGVFEIDWDWSVGWMRGSCEATTGIKSWSKLIYACI